MATSSYFSHNTSPAERTLLNSLIVESIQIMGMDVNYLPRSQNNIDSIFEDAERNSFTTSYTIEIHLGDDTIEGFGGEGDLISRFGVEVRDTVQLVMAQSRFTDVITAADATLTKPREGDLVYLPFSSQLYEITFVEDQIPFFQLGRNFTYQLECALFQYSDEELATGVAAIDSVETTYSYSIDLTMSAGGSGTFTTGTIIYQGTSATDSSARGEVISWDSGTRVLRVMNIQGDFTTGVAITDGTATWTLSSFDDLTLPTDKFAQNIEVETAADSGIVDFTESNPFGEF
tara:strand:- start:3113 stop:3979 length:867 start_codon:yes stop_codon:yes gene_type:complete